MDFTENEEGESMTNSKRQDLEELIALLGDYKLKIENESEAKPEATLSEEDVFLQSLVEKMVLIKKKSLAEFSMNECSNNRLNEEDDSDTSNEDNARESEGLMAAHTPAASSENIVNGSLSGGIKVSDLEELISMFNEFLDMEESEDDATTEVDFSEAVPCSKLVRKLTVVEEILLEKRNSSHCLVPNSCSGSICKEDYMRDTHGICRKVVTVVRAIRNPKRLAQKKTNNADF